MTQIKRLIDATAPHKLAPRVDTPEAHAHLFPVHRNGVSMSTVQEHTHRNEDGTVTVHSHEGGDREHHHNDPKAGEHAHELPDGTKVVHHHEGGDADHQH